jgi:hypothetical protein
MLIYTTLLYAGATGRVPKSRQPGNFLPGSNSGYSKRMGVAIAFGGLKKKLTAVVFLLAAANASFSFGQEGFRPATVVQERVPAVVKQTVKEGRVICTFAMAALPDETTLQRSLEKFGRTEGFVSLAVNTRNEVEVITAKSISEKDKAQILAISVRLYGYLGYRIAD